jgi:hypothetical protein
VKKKTIVIAAIALLIITTLAITFSFISSNQTFDNTLSKEQQEIVDVVGYPDQFFITYLPQAEQDLVRTEVWYYPRNEMKITFLQGKTFSVEDFTTDEEIIPTTLRPENFDFYQTYDEVEEVLGTPVEPLDFLPEFYEPGELETYVTKEAIFVFERSFLTYFQTIGLTEVSADE